MDLNIRSVLSRDMVLLRVKNVFRFTAVHAPMH